MIKDVFVGIDVSKDKFDTTLLLEAKNVHKVFENSPSGFKKLLAWLLKHQVSKSSLWVCMEATGHYSELLANFLLTESIRVSVVNPLQIKHFLKAKLTRNKNDKVDSNGIAEFAKVMRPPFYVAIPANKKELREKIQLVDTLKNQVQQLKNQLSSIQSSSVKESLEKAIADLEKHIKLLEEEIGKNVDQEEQFSSFVNLIISIKGFGKTSAYRLLAYLPDLALFEKPKQLAAFIGVSPKQKESGKFIGKTCLSKFGNPRLRKTLYMPALSVKQFNTAFKPFINSLEKKGLKPKAIVGALMRKLVHIIFGMVKSQKPFDPKLV
jgi:transposase